MAFKMHYDSVYRVNIVNLRTSDNRKNLGHKMISDTHALTKNLIQLEHSLDLDSIQMFVPMKKTHTKNNNKKQQH